MSNRACSQVRYKLAACTYGILPPQPDARDETIQIEVSDAEVVVADKCFRVAIVHSRRQPPMKEGGVAEPAEIDLAGDDYRLARIPIDRVGEVRAEIVLPRVAEPVEA